MSPVNCQCHSANLYSALLHSAPNAPSTAEKAQFSTGDRSWRCWWLNRADYCSVPDNWTNHGKRMTAVCVDHPEPITCVRRLNVLRSECSRSFSNCVGTLKRERSLIDRLVVKQTHYLCQASTMHTYHWIMKHDEILIERWANCYKLRIAVF